MKWNKKLRIVALSLVLLTLVIAGGVLLLFGGKFVTNPVLEQVPDENLQYVLAGEKTVDYKWNLYRYLTRIGDHAATLRDAEYVDVGSGATLMKLPENMMLEHSGMFISLCLNEDKSFGILTLDSEIDRLLFWQYSEEGKRLCGPIALEADDRVFTGEGSHRWATVQRLAFDGENICLIASLRVGEGEVLQVFDIEGKLRFRHSASYYDLDGEGALYFAGGNIDNTGIEFARLDLSTLKLDYEVTMSEWPLGLQVHRESGTVYYKTERTIFMYNAKDGTKLGEAFDMYAASELPADDSRALDFLVGADKAIYLSYIMVDAPKQVRCFRYTLQEVLPDDRPSTLTISAPYRSEYIAQLIGRFEREYPDQKVQYDYAYSDEKSFGPHANEYYTKLSARLLTGDIGDLIMLGGERTTVRSALTADMLIDLAPLLAAEPDRTQYDVRMLNGIELEGAVRAVALTEYFPYLEVDVSLLRKLGIEIDYANMSWSEFLRLTQVLEEKAPDVALLAWWKGYETPEDIGLFLQRMLVINSFDLFNPDQKTVDLHQPWFIELLELWKRTSQSPNFMTAVSDELWRQGDITQGRALFYMEASGDDMRYHYDRDKLYLYAIHSNNGEHAYVSLPRGEQNSNRIAYSDEVYGISARSNAQQTAWNFLAFAARADNQGLKTARAIPLNTQARRARFDVAFNEWSRLAQLDTVQRGARDILAICDKVDYLYDSGDYKHDLYQSVMRYLNDELTLDEALDEAEYRIMIRMNE